MNRASSGSLRGAREELARKGGCSMLRANAILLAGFVAGLCSSAAAREPSDYLALAVGNSWTYDHFYSSMMDSIHAPFWGSETFTISITHTEGINGNLYYVFDVPDHEWPFPCFFLAGKKVRFAGDGRLLELTDGVEICVYDLSSELAENPYPIPEHEGDTQVTRNPSSGPSKTYSFAFLGHANPSFYEWETRDTRTASFYARLGMRHCRQDVWPVNCNLLEDCDYPSESNRLDLVYASIDGVRVEWKDLLNATPASSWGDIKQRF